MPIDNILNLGGVLLFISLVLMCGVAYLFPLLDQYVYWCWFASWSAAAVLSLATTGQSAEAIALIGRIFALAGIVLILFPIFLTLNAILDFLPSVHAETRVIHKSTLRGKGRTTFRLVVSPSWRDGRNREKFDVPTQAWFDEVAVGELVQVEVHPGRFGLPWGARLTNPSRPD